MYLKKSTILHKNKHNSPLNNSHSSFANANVTFFNGNSVNINDTTPPFNPLNQLSISNNAPSDPVIPIDDVDKYW